MKIVNKPKNTVAFGTVFETRVFTEGNNVYLKLDLITKSRNNGQINAVDLQTGEYRYFAPDEKIVPVSAVLTIS